MTTVCIVFTAIFRFNKSHALIKSGTFSTKVMTPTGNPVMKLIKRAIPETPPGAIRHGSIKHQVPRACKSAPKKSYMRSFPVSFQFIFNLLYLLLFLYHHRAEENFSLPAARPARRFLGISFCVGLCIRKRQGTCTPVFFLCTVSAIITFVMIPCTARLFSYLYVTRFSGFLQPLLSISHIHP